MTAADLWKFIDTYRRVTGKLPRLRECVEHFEGNLLNVMMCLTELKGDEADAIRRQALLEREERQARKQAAEAVGGN